MRSGNSPAVHHRLGYEQPDRAGFGGLWSAMDAETDRPAVTVVERHVVARSDGPRSAEVRAGVAAFAAVLRADTADAAA